MTTTKRKAAKRKRHWSDALVRQGACIDGLEYARKHTTFASAWEACRVPAWLGWIVRRCSRTVDRYLAAQDAAEPHSRQVREFGLMLALPKRNTRACNAIRAAVKRPRLRGLR